ncbi:MAG: sel1 repeat family protein [Xanthomonadaceae bacterium]|nr:sel1 repeat family protein [Xanthomonadaceae bacterium]
MNPRISRTGLAVLGSMLLAAFLTSCATTQDDGPRPWQPTKRYQEVLSSETFLSDHPDMLNRKRAMEELERGKPERAAEYFERSAYYADKQSQAAYAEMLWEGRGMPQDKAAAYAWMDLAAERNDEFFLGFRERYWRALGEADRQKAIEIGQEVYAKYGDDVAKPRIERILKRALRKTTGSRVGFVGNLTIMIPSPSGLIIVNGDTYYDKRFWEPKQYWQWQKAVLETGREGKVIVGDFKQIKKKTSETKPKPNED